MRKVSAAVGAVLALVLGGTVASSSVDASPTVQAGGCSWC